MEGGKTKREGKRAKKIHVDKWSDFPGKHFVWGSLWYREEGNTNTTQIKVTVKITIHSKSRSVTKRSISQNYRSPTKMKYNKNAYSVELKS